jgi:hypothetical protein
MLLRSLKLALLPVCSVTGDDVLSIELDDAAEVVANVGSISKTSVRSIDRQTGATTLQGQTTHLGPIGFQGTISIIPGLPSRLISSFLLNVTLCGLEILGLS